MTRIPGRDGPVLIDGGLATQCEAQGYNIDGPLWSAKLLLENPQAIVDANRAYLDAGAQIIATASYQASRQGLAAEGLSHAEADKIILKSVALAIQARDEFLTDNPEADKPLVAASIGPFGAALHDGSEYTGAYDATRADLEAFHRPRLELLDQSDADLLACETIPAIEEADVLSELLQRVESPSWVSFCCRDDAHISDGTRIEEAVRIYEKHPCVFAVGVNCTAPQFITPLIERIKKTIPDKAIVVYPNSGESYQSEDNSWQGDASVVGFEAVVAEWARAGATLIGGCCRVGPDQIRAMADSATFKR